MDRAEGQKILTLEKPGELPRIAANSGANLGQFSTGKMACFEQVIVAPDELDPPQDHEFYGMSSMVYRGFRIGFLSVFHVMYEGIVAREGLPGQKT